MRSIVLAAVLLPALAGCGAVLSVSPEGDTSVDTLLPGVPSFAGGTAARADDCAALATLAGDASLSDADRAAAVERSTALGC